jgi:hypothetical protein
MKKLFKLLDFLWENEILDALKYIITLGWFACAASIVRTYGGTLGKIFFFAWAIILAFNWLIHKSTKKE